MSNTKDTNIRRCGNCIYFWDRWADGTGKCERAFDGITNEMSGTNCKVFKCIDELPTTKHMK